MKLTTTWIFALLISFSCFGRKHSFPILVLADDQHFGTYTGEILKAEGFNEFKIESLSLLTKQDLLKEYDIVILAGVKPDKSQIILLKNYLNQGGNLITFRPDSDVASLMGVRKERKFLKEGYIKIDTTHFIGKGLVSQTIQFHGISNLYTKNGGEEIARLYSDSRNSTEYSSLIINHIGRGIGALFSYNLPESIVLTRQGNPEWAGEERDHVDGPTSTDLFYPFQDQIQWNDPEKIAIPQADEHMRLLSHVIEYMSQNKKPLPKFWYFPDLYKSIFVFTIDGEDSKEKDIDQEIMDVQSKKGNATLYEIGTYIKPETVQKWRNSGNEVAIHFNDVPNYKNPLFANMKEVIDTMTCNFRKAYGYLPKTARNHWVIWVSRDSSGNKEFSEQALLEARYGIGFDCNYYQFGGNKVYPNWIGDVGHFNGSGIPMKFSTSEGKIVSIYQSNTQLPDETWLSGHLENKSKILIDRSLDQEYYAWINANNHTWYWKECRAPALKVLDYCNQRGVPVWTAERAYEFLRMKDEACFANLKWRNHVLSFDVHSALIPLDRLTVMLPMFYGNMKIRQVESQSRNQDYKIMKIKDRDYAMIQLSPARTTHFEIIYH